MTTMLSLILAFMLSLGGSPAASVNPAGCPGDTGIQAPIDNNRTINHFSEDYNQKTASRANSKKTGKTPSINDLEPSSSIMFARFSIEKLRQASYYDHKSYRFNSVDPIINKEEALSNPQLWNLYAYCRNNPVTYLDPDGRLILKLKSWEVVNKTHPSGKSATGRTGYLLTDDRKSKIVATKYSKKEWRTNCIGYAFAEGKFWINPQENGLDQIQNILKGDNYKEGLKVGGVVLYKTTEDIYHNGTKIHNAGDYVHAAKVTSIENRTVMVTGIGGLGSEPETTEVSKGWKLSRFKVEYYHKESD